MISFRMVTQWAGLVHRKVHHVNLVGRRLTLELIMVECLDRELDLVDLEDRTCLDPEVRGWDRRTFRYLQVNINEQIISCRF